MRPEEAKLVYKTVERLLQVTEALGKSGKFLIERLDEAEKVVKMFARESQLPEDHPDVFALKQELRGLADLLVINNAPTKKSMLDAIALSESGADGTRAILEVWRKLFPPD